MRVTVCDYKRQTGKGKFEEFVLALKKKEKPTKNNALLHYSHVSNLLRALL